MKEPQQRQPRLHVHLPHPHITKNVNALHQAEQQGINTRIAVLLTRSAGSMPTAYLFVVLALIGLLAILGVLSPIVALLVAWLSQTFIQLVLLPVIMVGQNVLNRKQELQADEMFKSTMNAEHDIKQIIEHLDAQDRAMLEILRRLESKA